MKEKQSYREEKVLQVRLGNHVYNDRATEEWKQDNERERIVVTLCVDHTFWIILSALFFVFKKKYIYIYAVQKLIHIFCPH